MIKCDCGFENREGSKFCCACGAKLEQRCVVCNNILQPGAKFCSECGAIVNATESIQQSLVTPAVGIGDKNDIAGDVIITNTVQADTDETTKKAECEICGKHMTLVQGHTCPVCGMHVCNDCFNTGSNMCVNCNSRVEDKYAEAFADVLADGVVEREERVSLETLRNQCGISEERARQIELQMRKERADLSEDLSASEQKVMKNAIRLMYDEWNAQEAYKQLKPLYNVHPRSVEVVSEFLPVCAEANTEEAKNIAEKFNIDIPAKYIALFLVSMREHDMVLAERYLRMAKEAMTEKEAQLIDCCKLMFYEYMSEKYRDEESCKKAGQLRKTLESSNDMKVEYLINIMDKAVKDANQLLFADGISAMTTVYSELPKFICEGNTEKAFELYANAGKNNVIAKYMLAVCYYYGWGCPKNLIDAFNCLRYVLKTTSNTILRKNTEKLQTAVITDKDENGRTVLSLCCCADKGTFTLAFFKELIEEAGANVNARDNDGNTPLNLASKAGHAECMKLLIEHGADVNARDNDGNTPLNLASTAGHAECMKLLIEHGVDVNARNNDERTSLYLTSCNGHAECMKLLIEQGADVNAKDSFGNPPLNLASYNGYAECVKLLMEHGADVNARNNDGYPPLNLASYNGYTGCVKLLMEHGADVNARDNDGSTSLYLASFNGHSECMKLLIEHGADVSAKDNSGKAPLFGASEKGYTECIKLLIEHGADVNAKDNSGEAPLFRAARYGHVECMKLLIEHGADVNARDDDGNTPLNVALSNGHAACVKLLIEQGADVDVNAKDSFGETLLHRASGMGHTECVKLLIEQGADVNAKDSFGSTPLHSASQLGEAECVKLLREHGADVNATDLAGNTPLYWASHNGYAECVRLLEMHINCSEKKDTIDNNQSTKKDNKGFWDKLFG